MFIKIEIDCANEAFDLCSGDEAARILRELASNLEARHLIRDDYPLRDINGNKVGYYQMIDHI